MNDKAQFVHIENKKTSNSLPSKEVSNVVEKEDNRYVQFVSGFVRDKPDLTTSKKIAVVHFGDVINVKRQQKDPVVNNLTWLEYITDSGQKGWVSDKIVTVVSAHMDEKDFIEKAGHLTQGNQLTKILANLEKPGQSAEASNGVSLNIKQVTPTELRNQLGEPTLHDGEKAFLYHGTKHDYIFTLINSTSAFNILTVKNVAEE